MLIQMCRRLNDIYIRLHSYMSHNVGSSHKNITMRGIHVFYNDLCFDTGKQTHINCILWNLQCYIILLCIRCRIFNFKCHEKPCNGTFSLHS